MLNSYGPCSIAGEPYRAGCRRSRRSGWAGAWRPTGRRARSVRRSGQGDRLNEGSIPVSREPIEPDAKLARITGAGAALPGAIRVVDGAMHAGDEDVDVVRDGAVDTIGEHDGSSVVARATTGMPSVSASTTAGWLVCRHGLNRRRFFAMVRCSRGYGMSANPSIPSMPKPASWLGTCRRVSRNRSSPTLRARRGMLLMTVQPAGPVPCQAMEGSIATLCSITRTAVFPLSHPSRLNPVMWTRRPPGSRKGWRLATGSGNGVLCSRWMRGRARWSEELGTVQPAVANRLVQDKIDVGVAHGFGRDVHDGGA